MACSTHPPVQLLSDEVIIQAVRDGYSAIAKSGTATSYATRVAQAFGYTIEQLQSIPAESHMGLSCGNPVATANIKEGETVLDLGSGGGIDIFLASAKTGARGQAIGLDMTSDMISLARRNAKKQGLNPPQVSFVHAALTDPLPINSNSIDCILSNCVINLLPLSRKAPLFKETHRVLKPGGRIVLDDIIAKKPLPEDLSRNLEAYVGCVSGAVELQVYKSFLTDAGFQEILFVDSGADLSAYFKNDSTFPGCCTPKVDPTPTKTGCCTPKVDPTPTKRVGGCCGAPASQKTPAISLKDLDINDWVASYHIYAIKSSTTAAEEKIISEPLLRWWDAYPTATSSPGFISADELSAVLRDPSLSGEIAVIDVRGNNSGGRVRGSFQYPAQDFYNGLIAFSEKFGEKEQIVFYCSNSNGRGPRCASWYLDYLDEVGKPSPKVQVLQGGIVSFLEKFGDHKEMVDYE